MTPREILDYWFSDRLREHWFAATPELDREIREKFERSWERAAAGELDDWQQSPDACLALIILLDQLPLNMFRGQAKSFQTEAKAIQAALQAIEKGFATQLSKDQLSFLFMPLMHSEQIAHQELSVKLYAQHGLTYNLKFAEHHRDIISKFGRFPHRNAILGRQNTAAETAYLNSKHAFKG